MSFLLELTQQELKRVQLDILKDVASFCDKHGLRYSLCGGTLLGAVRHNGFIPWDDDIDIFMPRPDFIKFMHGYNENNKRYQARSIHYDKKFWNKIGHVFDLNTKLEYPSYNVDSSVFHVFIDIFPLDGVPKGQLQKKTLFILNKVLHVLYGGSVYSYVKSMRYVDQKGLAGEWKEWIRTAMKFIAILLFRPLPTSFICQLATKNAMRYSYNECTEIAAYVGGRYQPEKEIMTKCLFEKMQKHIFEDGFFWITEAYDVYLSNLYGDYMKLPPKDKQVSHHDFKAYWKEGCEPIYSSIECK